MKITGKLSSEYKTYAREISQGNVISATALNVVSASPHHYPKTTGAERPAHLPNGICAQINPINMERWAVVGAVKPSGGRIKSL
jgi:hypothetical protein